MMKILAGMMLAMGLAVSTPQSAQAHTTLGAVAGYPELGGVYLSYFPHSTISLDGWATLSTVDGGVSGHIPLAQDVDNIHSIVLTGLVGYSHNLLPMFPYNNVHSLFAAGYGFRGAGGWDIRVQAGVTANKTPLAEYSPGFHGHLMVGHTL